MLGRWIQNGGAEAQQGWGGLGHAKRCGTAGETDGLAGVGIQTEEGLKRLERFDPIFSAVAAHLTLSEAMQAVRVDGQELATEVTAGAS